MAEWAARLGRAVADLVALSGDTFTLDGFARVLATGCAEICVGCDVGVVLVGEGDQRLVTAGSVSWVADFEASVAAAGNGAAGDAVRSGSAARSRRFDDARWRAQRPAAQELGYAAVRGFVLRHGEQTHGVIDVFEAGGTASAPVELLGPLVEVAAAHLSRELALRAASRQVEQLQGALDSRVVIEQAKGLLAQRSGVSMVAAFASLRKYARDRNLRLHAVCASVVTGEIDLADVDLVFEVMTAARRAELRDRALERWRGVTADAEMQRARASASVSRSVELRIELEHQRAHREMQTLGRALDRQLRRGQQELRPANRARPRVLLGEERSPIHEFVIDTLSGDLRFDLADEGLDFTEIVAGSVVEQPDLVILGPDASRVPGDDVLARLRRYCPDSRTLVVVEPQDAPTVLASLAGRRVGGFVTCGDSAMLVRRTLDLCGLGSVKRS